MFAQVHAVPNTLKITRKQQDFYQPPPKDVVRYLSSMSESAIYQRIKSRLDALGMSERQASLKVAGNPQFIRNIRKGASASPRGENILKLARVLQVSESWLLGTSDDLGDPPNVAMPFGVRFGGIAQAGLFRPNDDQDQEAETRRVPLPADPRYPAASQLLTR